MEVKIISHERFWYEIVLENRFLYPLQDFEKSDRNNAQIYRKCYFKCRWYFKRQNKQCVMEKDAMTSVRKFWRQDDHLSH